MASKEIYEYRGVEGLVYAEVLTDTEDSNGYTTGNVKPLAGVAEIGRSTENSQEAHYYDNMPAVVIASQGADTVTISVSAIPFDAVAEITGQTYDEATGAFIEGNRTPKYFAIGYKTKRTNGNEIYTWRYKGMFSIPDQTNSTENDGTDANGQELTFTGIQTTHKFTKTGKGAKAMNVDVSLDKVDVSNFFETVVTPDSLKAKGEVVTETLNITIGAETSEHELKDLILPSSQVHVILKDTGNNVVYNKDVTIIPNSSLPSGVYVSNVEKDDSNSYMILYWNATFSGGDTGYKANSLAIYPVEITGYKAEISISY